MPNELSCATSWYSLRFSARQVRGTSVNTEQYSWREAVRANHAHRMSGCIYRGFIFSPYHAQALTMYARAPDLTTSRWIRFLAA
jgi:hypothetical protein